MRSDASRIRAQRCTGELTMGTLALIGYPCGRNLYETQLRERSCASSCEEAVPKGMLRHISIACACTLCTFYLEFSAKNLGCRVTRPPSVQDTMTMDTERTRTVTDAHS